MGRGDDMWSVTSAESYRTVRSESALKFGENEEKANLTWPQERFHNGYVVLGDFGMYKNRLSML